MKIAIQIDFDGTVTEEDISFLILDKYASPAWRRHLKLYNAGKITVGAFNKRAFATVKADRNTLTDFVLSSPRLKIRPGFRELLAYCARKGFKITIVSNGLKFYIEAILEDLGLRHVDALEIFAAENEFDPGGMKVAYMGPDGREMEAGFKEAYTELLNGQGYSVVYIGNGGSDIYPSRKAKWVFAVAQLLDRCRTQKLDCIPFNDFYDVIEGLKAKIPA